MIKLTELSRDELKELELFNKLVKLFSEYNDISVIVIRNVKIEKVKGKAMLDLSKFKSIGIIDKNIFKSK